MLNRQPGGLVALMAQIDTAFAGLQEFGARLEAIKASAAILHSDLTREAEALREALETRNNKDDNPDRLVPLKEAAKLRGVSLDTLTCRSSPRRYGNSCSPTVIPRRRSRSSTALPGFAIASPPTACLSTSRPPRNYASNGPHAARNSVPSYRNNFPGPT
jgi:hypothetical protein